MATMLHALYFFIFLLSLSFALFAVPASKMQTGPDPKTQIVVAIPFRPGLPLDHNWYTADYVDYIADLLPSERYQVTGYFVSLANIPQFLDDLEKYAQKGKVSVLNFCDGGEWDGYPGISLNRLWEKHAINGAIPRSGADAQFILNSDDKLKMQTFLSRANLKSLPQTLISPQRPLDKAGLTAVLAQEGLSQSWPLFCKLNVGAAALGINDASICQNIEQLLVEIQQLHALFPKSDIILQPYLPGPEYTVLVLGEQVYAAVRRDFHNANNIMYEDYMTGIRNIEDEITYLPAPLHVQKIAVNAIQAIPGKHHYTRVDLRDDAKGNTFVIDINERPAFGTPSTVKCMLEFNHLSEAQFLRDIVETCFP